MLEKQVCDAASVAKAGIVGKRTYNSVGYLVDKKSGLCLCQGWI